MTLIARLQKIDRLNITIFLIFMSLFCFGISILRYYITDTKMFLFLNWNLFLAFIPWLISTLIVIRGNARRLSLIFLILSWLLFFPNSPYILTDLFHLKANGSAPIWFDLVVIMSFAWTGLLYGFISLMDIESLLRNHLKPRAINLLIIGFFFLAGFGIYLGRFLRWNSWDILQHPGALMTDVVDRFVDPMSHPRTWGVTILMGILLNMMYFSVKLLRKERGQF